MTCPSCDGTKWIVIEHAGGLTAAKRCPQCSSVPNNAEALPTIEQCGAALKLLARSIAFAPKDTPTITFLAQQLQAMVNTAGEMHWLIQTACGVLTEWRGFAQLRGIYCSSGYHPRDQIYIKSDISGFAAVGQTSEQRYFELQCAEQEQKQAEYRQAALIAGAVEPEPLPAPKPMPPAKASSAVFRMTPYVNGAGFSLQREKLTNVELEAELTALAAKQQASRRSADEIAREIEILEARLRLKNAGGS